MTLLPRCAVRLRLPSRTFTTLPLRTLVLYLFAFLRLFATACSLYTHTAFLHLTCTLCAPLPFYAFDTATHATHVAFLLPALHTFSHLVLWDPTTHYSIWFPILLMLIGSLPTLCPFNIRVIGSTIIWLVVLYIITIRSIPFYYYMLDSSPLPPPYFYYYLHLTLLGLNFWFRLVTGFPFWFLHHLVIHRVLTFLPCRAFGSTLVPTCWFLLPLVLFYSHYIGFFPYMFLVHIHLAGTGLY